jgi:hypothetical protein
MTTKTKQVMELLAEARPPAAAPGRRERDEDLAVILASPRAVRPRRAPLAGTRRRTRVVRVAGLVAAAVVAAVVVQAVAVSPPAARGGAAVSASAAQVALRDLAKVADSGDEIVPPPGGFWYTKTLWVERVVWPVDGNFHPDSRFWTAAATSTEEYWVSTARPGRVKSSPPGPLSFPTEQDRRLYEVWRERTPDADAQLERWFSASGEDEFSVDPASGPASPTPPPNLAESRVPLRELPLEPDALTRKACLEKPSMAPEYRPMDRWDCMTRLLLTEAAGPALRAATFEAISRMPGIELVGRDVTDRTGRHGVGIAMRGLDAGNGPVRDVMIFDPRTTRALSLERTKVGLELTPELEMEPKAELGLVFARVHLASGTTRSTSERP